MAYIPELLDLCASNSMNVKTSFLTYIMAKQNVLSQVLALINRRSPRGSFCYHK